MNLDLDKDDLIALVKGSQPNYSVMSNPLIEKNGRFWSSGRWEWDSFKLEKCSEEQLVEIYKICKDSWK